MSPLARVLPTTRLAGFEPAETLHQIESRTVNLDRINRRPAMEPLAPTRGISGAPPPKRRASLSPPRPVLKTLMISQGAH